MPPTGPPTIKKVARELFKDSGIGLDQPPKGLAAYLSGYPNPVARQALSQRGGRPDLQGQLITVGKKYRLISTNSTRPGTGASQYHPDFPTDKHPNGKLYPKGHGDLKLSVGPVRNKVCTAL
jgi:hypothetical protein